MRTGKEIVSRALEVLRQEGIKSLWFKILGETVYRRMVLFERSLDGPIAEVIPRLPVTIRPLRDADVLEYTRFRPEISPDEVHRRLASGQMCFAAWYEGRIVHAAWVAMGRAWIGYLAREVALASDDIYYYESFTAPDFRGQNIAGASLSYMQQALQKAGYRRILAAIMPENKPAFRPVEKTGFRPIGVMGYVRLGPWRWDFIHLRPGARPPGQPVYPCDADYW
ncbi:MAG: GNAT family N-acetyltransferase, partial [Chloroflexi bacterium]|nr:GNAT family N-acetyltransferase [Chloroflexota bacterium]